MLKSQGAAAHGTVGGTSVRRVVYCDGVRGVLEQRDGCWLIRNEAEVQTIVALGGNNRALSRMRVLVATLNAGLVDAGPNLTELSRILHVISQIGPKYEECRCAECRWQTRYKSEPHVSDVSVPRSLRPAVAFACTFSGYANGTQWLAWALAARLYGNLCRRHPPELSLRRLHVPIADLEHDCDIGWLEGMPEVFWDRLGAPDCCKSVPRSSPLCPSDEKLLCLRSVAAASDPRTSRRVLAALAGSAQPEVVELVVSNPATPRKELRRVVYGAPKYQIRPRERIAARYFGPGRPDTDYLRVRVAQSRRASRSVRRRLAGDSSARARGHAAAGDNMPAAELKRLSEDEDEWVRQVVGGRTSTPASALRMLASDPDIGVRCAVASNEACPVDSLKRLLGDRRREVRAAAAENRSTPWHLVDSLQDDPARDVRAAVENRFVRVGYERIRAFV